MEINSQLSKLWGDFKDKAELNCILQRNFIFSEVQPCDILILGINPSDDKTNIPSSFKFSNSKGVYFNKFHKIANAIDPTSKYIFDYLDVFCFRETHQSNISIFLKNSVGVSFLCEHLTITQNIIEELKPKLIIVFNKLAGNFLGVNAKKVGSDYTNIWLGYEFFEPENYNCKIIAGFKNSNERINKNITASSLIGTPVYFSKYLGRSKNIEIETIIEEIKHVINNHLYFDDRFTGRNAFIQSVNKLNNANTEKLNAIEEGRYEESARLRDKERDLLKSLENGTYLPTL